jgi:hypothetical protein
VVRAVNGDVLAKRVSFADSQPGESARKAKVLRGSANDTAGAKYIPWSGNRPTREMNVRIHPAAFSQFHISIDDGIGSHLDG